MRLYEIKIEKDGDDILLVQDVTWGYAGETNEFRVNPLQIPLLIKLLSEEINDE